MTEKEREKFMARVGARTDSGCEEWTGLCDDWGYGKFFVGGKYKKAHRLAWELRNGEIPNGLLALHRCDNPPCCRAEHLFLGTNADNAADKVAKNRQSRGDAHRRRAKITRAQAAEIVSRRGTATQKEIADSFGISQTQVSKILRGECWV